MVSRTARTHDRARRAAAAREAVRRRRRRQLLRNVVVAAALAVLVTAGIAVQATRDSSGVGDGPRGSVAGYGVPIGTADAPVLVEVYLDYLCPACRSFETAAGPMLDRLVESGTVRVVYRPIAILDAASSTRYSTRAANAAACAADAGSFGPMQKALFRYQPAEGGPGLSDEQLIELGRSAGATGDAFTTCVRARQYVGWTRRATDQASKDAVTRTPTVLVDGKQLALPTVAALRQAVTAASR